MATTATKTAIAKLVEPDETAYDLIHALQNSCGTGLACIDAHLRIGSLGPGEMVVIHGESGAGKSILLQNILVAYIAPDVCGGHGLPAILIDADNTFNMSQLVQILEKYIRRTIQTVAEDGSFMVAPDEAMIKTFVEEAVSRLLVLRPKEPIDMLRHLRGLCEVLAANPTTALLMVDSMTAWQPLAAAFQRTMAQVLNESWRALSRLQQKYCIAVVVAYRDIAADSGANGAGQTAAASAGITNCCHLTIQHTISPGPASEFTRLEQPEENEPEFHGEMFKVSSCARMIGDPLKSVPFKLSDVGEVINVAC